MMQKKLADMEVTEHSLTQADSFFINSTFINGVFAVS